MSGAWPNWQQWNADWADRRRLHQLVWAFVALGVLARCVRYFVCFPLWEDECFLAANLIDRDYGELLAPLRFWQVCPAGFLWLQMTVTRVFGFHEMTLRLIPFLAGVASVFVFRQLAIRLFKGTALLTSVAIFAVSYPLVRYSAEAKPYAGDLFLSLLLVWLAVEWWHRSESTRWLWLLAAAVPFAVVLSFPVVFVAGGVSLLVAHVLARKPGARGWLPWAAFNLTLVGSFLAMYALSIRPQSEVHLEHMRTGWAATFPPLTSLTGLAKWLLVTHASDVLGHPLGGERGGSTLTFLCCLLGLIAMVRSRQWTLLVLVVSPFGLTFIAAALERYPYGGHVRMNLYLAPLICVLAGVGVAAWLSRYAARPASLRRRVQFAVALLAVIAAGTIVRDVVHPCKSVSDMRQRAFARWFWTNAAHSSEVACAHGDFSACFSLPPPDKLSLLAQHICNRQIYSPRHASGRRLRLDRVSVDRPLRCVLYKDGRLEFDEQAFQRWFANMTRRFELVGRQEIPIPRYDKHERELQFVDQLVMFEFALRSASHVDGGSALRTGAESTAERLALPPARSATRKAARPGDPTIIAAPAANEFERLSSRSLPAQR